MEELIPISTLNDFIFCPYSIYLHNIYMETDEDLYHAVPQTRGRAVHESIDKKSASTSRGDLLALPICSEELGVIGKIDLYRKKEKLLIERKYQLKQVFKGQIYQLWAQYFCMTEMGYEVERLAFYEISTNTMLPIEIPTEKDKNELVNFIHHFRNYSPDEKIKTNSNKCAHCIYCNLCDKTDYDNVYS